MASKSNTIGYDKYERQFCIIAVKMKWASLVLLRRAILMSHIQKINGDFGKEETQ